MILFKLYSIFSYTQCLHCQVVLSKHSRHSHLPPFLLSKIFQIFQFSCVATAKNFFWDKSLNLSEKQHFVWYTASQSKQSQDMLEIF